VIVPTAGGTILPKVAKAFEELKKVGLIDDPHTPKIYTAQAAGCAPVIHALHKGSDLIVPVKPNTIAKSIAIGNPADGYYVLKAVRESGGWGEAATDQEIVAAIQLLAQTEGIFTEPAGGTTVAVTKKLIEQGRIPRNESIVICVTGNGYKTIEAVLGHVKQPYEINARLQDFDELYQSLNQSAPSRAAAEELH
jgi:threonine synthase